MMDSLTILKIAFIVFVISPAIVIIGLLNSGESFRKNKIINSFLNAIEQKSKQVCSSVINQSNKHILLKIEKITKTVTISFLLLLGILRLVFQIEEISNWILFLSLASITIFISLQWFLHQKGIFKIFIFQKGIIAMSFYPLFLFFFGLIDEDIRFFWSDAMYRLQPITQIISPQLSSNLLLFSLVFTAMNTFALFMVNIIFIACICLPTLIVCYSIIFLTKFTAQISSLLNKEKPILGFIFIVGCVSTICGVVNKVLF